MKSERCPRVENLQLHWASLPRPWASFQKRWVSFNLLWELDIAMTVFCLCCTLDRSLLFQYSATKELMTARKAPFHSQAEKTHYLLPLLPCAILQPPLHLLPPPHRTCCIGSVSVLRWTGELKWNPTFADAQLQEVLVSPFLNLFKVSLKNSPLLQCIWHPPQFGSICKLAESTLCPIIQVISKDITHFWPQCQYFRGTWLVTSKYQTLYCFSKHLDPKLLPIFQVCFMAIIQCISFPCSLASFYGIWELI